MTATSSPLKRGGPTGPSDAKRLGALILAIKISGIVGFVGLLVAAHYRPRGGADLRVCALLWFAVFGIAYVIAASKIVVGGGRRWP